MDATDGQQKTGLEAAVEDSEVSPQVEVITVRLTDPPLTSSARFATTDDLVVELANCTETEPPRHLYRYSLVSKVFHDVFLSRLWKHAQAADLVNVVGEIATKMADDDWYDLTGIDVDEARKHRWWRYMPLLANLSNRYYPTENQYARLFPNILSRLGPLIGCQGPPFESVSSLHLVDRDDSPDMRLEPWIALINFSQLGELSLTMTFKTNETYLFRILPTLPKLHTLHIEGSVVEAEDDSEDESDTDAEGFKKLFASAVSSVQCLRSLAIYPSEDWLSGDLLLLLSVHLLLCHLKLESNSSRGLAEPLREASQRVEREG